jgi:hypothetical protein
LLTDEYGVGIVTFPLFGFSVHFALNVAVVPLVGKLFGTLTHYPLPTFEVSKKVVVGSTPTKELDNSSK